MKRTGSTCGRSRDGYALIDLQLHDTAFSSVWYRKSDGVLD